MGNPYARHYNTKVTPSSQKIPGSTQVPNQGGGFSWSVDKWTRLDRFLILGSEGNTYYATEQKMVLENAQGVLKCIKEDGLRVVKKIVEVSANGKAYKNDPALFALAMCLKLGALDTKRAASGAFNDVVRIGTHLFHIADYVSALGGWGRLTKRTFKNWYLQNKNLPLQLGKYQSRDGYSHRDIMRLCHVHIQKEMADFVNAPYKAAESVALGSLPDFLQGMVKAHRAASVEELRGYIRDYKLPRECLPTESLNNSAVWEALLPEMGLTAVIRNLGNMTKNGLLTRFSDATKLIEKKMSKEEIRRSKVHPIQILAAMLTYAQGHGMRGKGVWEPVQGLVDLLNDSFYVAFDNVEPTNKNICIGLDVSGSMSSGTVGGVPGLTPRIASCALSMITYKTEKYTALTAFSGRLVELRFSSRQRLDDICNETAKISFGVTDPALPVLAAEAAKWPIDAFVIYTDNENNTGRIHAAQALKNYRKRTGINAKMVVVGMVSNGFTVANPNDAGMLDVVGFSTDTPAVINNFIR